MNRTHIVTGLVISLSLFAAFFAALAWRAGRSDVEAASLRRLEDRAGALAEKLDRVVENLEALALQVDRFAAAEPGRGQAADPSSAAGAEGGGPAGAEPIRALVEKLDGIAGRIERASTSGRVSTSVGVAEETVEDRARIVGENRPIAVDSRRPVGERLEALRQLRFRDGRSPDVVQAMMDLVETPDLEPRLRADIIRNLDGVEVPELKEPLLRILATDRHVETLSETIETLQIFYDDPAVRAAVVHLRDNDENIRVRVEALERLAQYDEAKERLEKAKGR